MGGASFEDGSPFWRFSLRIYRQDGFAPACLALQDGHGVDVNVMLFGLWLASQGRMVSQRDFDAIESAVGGWREGAVINLRAARRFLRQPPAGFDMQGAEALRSRVKAVELEAERLQQEALYALRSPEGWGSPGEPHEAARCNLVAYAGSLGAVFESGAVEALLAGFAKAINA